MTARRTLERMLRDEDDASAQTVRSWRLQRDGDHVTIARDEHADWFSIRAEDVPQLVADLEEIAKATPWPPPPSSPTPSAPCPASTEP